MRQEKKRMPVRMADMTVAEARRAIARGLGVILPVGVVEQHGYHLPLSTDIYNACELADRVSARTGWLVAPPLNYNYSGGELPGTINVHPHVVSLFVAEICAGLARQGFENILVLLGHGGSESVRCIREGGEMFLRQNPQFEEVCLSVVLPWEFSATWAQAFEDQDYHAAAVETSLMMYWQPALVRSRIATDSKAMCERLRRDPDQYQVRRKHVENECVVPHVRQAPAMRVGVMGHPERASAKLGKKVCEEAVDGIAGLIRKIKRERARPTTDT